MYVTSFILLWLTPYISSAATSMPLETTTPIVNNFMTWGFLGTMAGAVSATTLIVQFLKIPLDKVWRIPTRFVVYFIALILLLAVELVTSHLTLERVFLILLNGIVVAMASMGTYEVTFKKIEK